MHKGEYRLHYLSNGPIVTGYSKLRIAAKELKRLVL